MASLYDQAKNMLIVSLEGLPPPNVIARAAILKTFGVNRVLAGELQDIAETKIVVQELARQGFKIVFALRKIAYPEIGLAYLRTVDQWTDLFLADLRNREFFNAVVNGDFHAEIGGIVPVITPDDLEEYGGQTYPQTVLSFCQFLANKGLEYVFCPKRALATLGAHDLAKRLKPVCFVRPYHQSYVDNRDRDWIVGEPKKAIALQAELVIVSWRAVANLFEYRSISAEIHRALQEEQPIPQS